MSDASVSSEVDLEAAAETEAAAAVAAAAALRFRFHYLDDRGNETGLMSKAGHFDGETLWLDRAMLPVQHIVKTQRRHDRLILHLDKEAPAGGFAEHLAFDVTSGPIDALHASLNEIASATRARGRRRRLEADGSGDAFRSTECPHCRATIDLTGFDETPQVYCDYCDTVYAADGSGPAEERDYSLCDQTRLYARSLGFMELFVPWFDGKKPWRARRVHACQAAFKNTAYKMLLFNLPLMVGVPTALLQLVRVYKGAGRSGPAFRGLARANFRALGGRTAQATAGYRRVAERLGTAAGVKYNEGLALGQAEYFAEAAVAFNEALDDCANYRPAAELLGLALQRLGDTDALAELHRRWRVGSANGSAGDAPRAEAFALRLAEAA